MTNCAQIHGHPLFELHPNSSVHYVYKVDEFMNNLEKMQNRRAIESMRAGVPNQDVVHIMGCSQQKLEKRFENQLKDVVDKLRLEQQAPGMLVVGGFGSGKSHLLEYFKHLALENNFVCSKIVISKETPLYDVAKVYRAAIRSAIAPGKIGFALTEIVNSLKFNERSYADFFKWLNHENTTISRWFAATVFLFEYLKHNEEIRDRIIRFWAGDKLNISELKNWLKEIKDGNTYNLDRIGAKELAIQRLSFAPRLMIAAGYSGWIILVDEVELIGRYSPKQRAKSYAQLAMWLGMIEDSSIVGLSCVMTITDDFEAAVLDDKHDEEYISCKLGNSDSIDDLLLSRQAESGIQVIRKKIKLQEPDSSIINATFDKLRKAYSKAYEWAPPPEFIRPDPTAPMRQHVKRGIAAWDLLCLYPGYIPSIITVPIQTNYEEDTVLEDSDNEVSID